MSGRHLLCENCGRNTSELHPCPCGLTECPIAYGVCTRCRTTIERNAIAWRFELRETPERDRAVVPSEPCEAA